MSDPATHTLVEYRLSKVETDIAQLRETNRARARAERRNIAVALSFLGSIVFTLFGVIWSYRSVITRQ